MVATADPLPDTWSSASEPSFNALRHGMTATRFVPPEQDERRRRILSQLIDAFAPTAPEEWHCVEELALARARLYDVEAAAWERLEWEKAHAGERFDRRMLDQLDKDLAAWRKSPFIWRDILAMTWLGATHLARVWAEIADTLASSDGQCPLERIFDAIASTESGFGVDHVCFEGTWIIQRHLATAPDPEIEMERWLTASAEADQPPRSDQRHRARWILEKAPEPATARRELAAKAIAERDRWALRANDLRSRYETDRELAAGRAVGYVPSDEKATRESRLALRYLTSARNRVDKFERRLDALLKLRPVRKMRQTEGRRETPLSPSPFRLSDEETARMLAEIEEMEAGNAALDAENAALEAHTAAMEAEIAAMQAEDEAEQAAEEAALAASSGCPRNRHALADSGSPSVQEAPETRSGRRRDPAAIARSFRKRAKTR